MGSIDSIFVLHQSDTQHRAMRRNRWLGASSRGEGARCSRSSVFLGGNFEKNVWEGSLGDAVECRERGANTLVLQIVGLVSGSKGRPSTLSRPPARSCQCRSRLI